MRTIALYTFSRVLIGGALLNNGSLKAAELAAGQQPYIRQFYLLSVFHKHSAYHIHLPSRAPVQELICSMMNTHHANYLLECLDTHWRYMIRKG